MPTSDRTRSGAATRTLIAARILDGSGGTGPSPAWVTIAGGRIAAVGSGHPGGHPEDLGDEVLAPGFLDLQINGFGDCDFATATVDAVIDTVDRMSGAGVTGVLPTVCTAPLDAYPAILERLATVRRHRPGAVLGVHLEGPFLGGAPGAHPPADIRPVDRAFIDALVADPSRLVRLVTLAPEADPDRYAIRTLTAAGIRVALGHSTASYEDSLAAIDAGAVLATHLFNGMSPLHHRRPGLVGAALTDPRIVPTFISDGVHVHSAVVGMTLALRPDAVLVSDAVRSDATRLPDGTLAGSDVAIPEAVARLVRSGTPLTRAVRCATGNPARVLGASERGRVVPGARADLLAIDPATLSVRRVASGG